MIVLAPFLKGIWATEPIFSTMALMWAEMSRTYHIHVNMVWHPILHIRTEPVILQRAAALLAAAYTHQNMTRAQNSVLKLS